MLVTQTVANFLFELYKISILLALQSLVVLYAARNNIYSLYCWVQEQFFNKLCMAHKYSEHGGNRYLGLKVGFVVVSIYTSVAATLMALAFPPGVAVLKQEVKSFINSTGNGLPMITYVDLQKIDLSAPNWIETALCSRLTDCSNYNNHSVANPVSWPVTEGEIKPFNIMIDTISNISTVGWTFSSFNYMCNDAAAMAGGSNCSLINYSKYQTLKGQWTANMSTIYGNTNVSTYYTSFYLGGYDSGLADMLNFFSYNDGTGVINPMPVDNTGFILAQNSFIKQNNIARGSYALRQDVVEMHRSLDLTALDIIMVQEESIEYLTNITNFNTGALLVVNNDIITNPMKCKYAYNDYLKVYKTLNATATADRLNGYLMVFSYSQITRFNDDNTITVGACGFSANSDGTVSVLSDLANVTWIHHAEPSNPQFINVIQDDIATVAVIGSNGAPNGKSGSVKLTTPLYLNSAINVSYMNAGSNIYDAVGRNFGQINATMFMHLTEYLPNVIQSGQINITAYINTVGVRVNMPWEFILLPTVFMMITLAATAFLRFGRNMMQYKTTVLNTITTMVQADGNVSKTVHISLSDAKDTSIYINGNKLSVETDSLLLNKQHFKV